MADRPVRKIFNIFRGMNMKAAPPLLAENELYCLYAKGVDFSSGKIVSEYDMQFLVADVMQSSEYYSSMGLSEILLSYFSDGVMDYVRLTDDRTSGTDAGDANFLACPQCDIVTGGRVVRVIVDSASALAFLISGDPISTQYWYAKARGLGTSAPGLAGESFATPEASFSIDFTLPKREKSVFATHPTTGLKQWAINLYDAAYPLSKQMVSNANSIARFEFVSGGAETDNNNVYNALPTAKLEKRSGFSHNSYAWYLKNASHVADFPEKVKMGLSQMNPNFTTAAYAVAGGATDVWADATSKTYGISFVREYRGVRDESGLTFVTATNGTGAPATLTITRPSETKRLTWRGNDLDSPSWEAEARAEKTIDDTDKFFPNGNTIGWNIYRLEDGEFRLVEFVPVFNFTATGTAADDEITAGHPTGGAYTGTNMYINSATYNVFESSEITIQYGSTVKHGSNYYRYIGNRVVRTDMRYSGSAYDGVAIQKAIPTRDYEAELLSDTTAWEALGTTDPVVTFYVDVTTATADLGAIATTYTLADNGQLYNLDALPARIGGIASSLYLGRLVCFKGNTLYWSDAFLPTHFYSGVEAQFDSDICGVVVSDRTMYVVTTAGVFATSSTTFFSLTFERVYTEGALNTRAVCPYKTGLAFLSRKGAIILSGREVANITEGSLPLWLSRKAFSDTSLCESASGIGTDGDSLYISLGHYGTFKYSAEGGFVRVDTGAGFYGHEGHAQGFISGNGWCVGRFLTPLFYYDADEELKWRTLAQTRIVSSGGAGRHFVQSGEQSVIQTGEITLGRFGFKSFTKVVVKGSGDWEIVILDSDGEPLVYTEMTRDGGIDFTPDVWGGLEPAGATTGLQEADYLEFWDENGDVAAFTSTLYPDLEFYGIGSLYVSLSAGGRSAAYRSNIAYRNRNLGGSEFGGFAGPTTGAYLHDDGWAISPKRIPSLIQVDGTDYYPDGKNWFIYWPDGTSRVADVINADGEVSYGLYDDYVDNTLTGGLFCMGDVLHFKSQEGQHYWLRYLGERYIADSTAKFRPAEYLAKGMNPLLSADFVQCFPFKGQTIDFSTDEGSTFFLPFDERVDKFTIVLKGRGVINSIEVTGEETT